MKVFGKVILFLILLFVFNKDTFAVDVNITNYPSVIDSSPFEITVFVSGAQNGTNYLRADFYKEGSINYNYFGETFNGSSWIKSSIGTDYFPVQIQDSTSSATFQVKIGTPSSSEYPGPGNFKLKIRRYTSEQGYTFGSPVDIQINYSSPSPTPSPTPSSQPTEKPITPSPTVSPTIKTTSKPTSTPTTSPSSSPDETVESQILSAEVVDDPTSLPSKTGGVKKPLNKFMIISTVIITIGLGFVGTAGYLAYRMRYNTESETKN